MNSITLLLREIRYFTNFSNKMYIFLLFFQPLMFLTIIYFMMEIRGGFNSDNPDRLIIAPALISMWSYVLYSSGSALISQKWNDTLELLLAAPTSLFSIILTKTISNSLIALISMIVTITYAKFIFGFNFNIPSYWKFFFSIIVLIIALAVVGMILSIVFVAFQNAFAFQNVILIPIILICGIFTPLEQLPLILKITSYTIPMTWGIQTVYNSLVMDNLFFFSLTMSIIVSLLYFIVAYVVIKKIEKVLRNNGKLGVI